MLETLTDEAAAYSNVSFNRKICNLKYESGAQMNGETGFACSACTYWLRWDPFLSYLPQIYVQKFTQNNKFSQYLLTPLLVEMK